MAFLENEASFQQALLDLAAAYGWRVAHFRPAKTEKGWRTAVSADGKGFPDLVLVRGDRVIFAELKSNSGKLRPEQKDWLEALAVCKGVEVYVWRPVGFDAIKALLRPTAGNSGESAVAHPEIR